MAHTSAESSQRALSHGPEADGRQERRTARKRRKMAEDLPRAAVAKLIKDSLPASLRSSSEVQSVVQSCLVGARPTRHQACARPSHRLTVTLRCGARAQSLCR